MMDMNMTMTTGHGGMDMGSTSAPTAKRHKMWMWYHVAVEDTVLFENWTVFDAGTMVWTCFVVAAAGIILEAIKYARWATEKKISEKSFWTRHVIDTVYHFWQLVLAYILMNVYMVFSVYICLSLCLGLAIGHFIFASRTGN